MEALNIAAIVMAVAAIVISAVTIWINAKTYRAMSEFLNPVSDTGADDDDEILGCGPLGGQ